METMSQSPAPAPRPASSRGNPSAGDIVRSVVVLAVVILLVVWVAGWFRGDPVAEPEPVDYVAAAEGAAETATYGVLVPPELPDGWRATRATWDPTGQQWRLGLLTGDDAYVGVEQSATATEEDLLETYAPEATSAGEVEVAGASWRVFTEAAADRTTLSRSADGVSVLVTGSVSPDDVEEFAAGLQPVAPVQAAPTATEFLDRTLVR